MSIPNISVQNSPIPTITMPVDTFNMMVEGSYNLRIRSEKAEKEEKFGKQANEILKAENIELKNKCTKLERKKTEEGRLIQLIDDDLQSSKGALQYVCAVAGAILGGGLVLAFPPTGAVIALGGTGSAALGAAIAGGATGGYLIAPVVHEKTHKAIIQQVQNFKAKEEASKKVE
ncbi:hypothetical protein [Candidatus Rhabdochlamydia porcellionis]|jgi:hypothetical protein|uniref:Uncharacterized protein n=1 Tax=Candidatus Rhabdochlamydia porcellionis TaxID=225148 RepID=A0ABX8Z5A3_9BACT|nr:hypothetical protein [Candidatus Rhabdochlamydia porcellionis]QZA59291.1 hypothetical protein RHAB15C_0001177 [Candidatus Rhabdochlamydia porcellionis]